jgi:hypothetical protein
MLIDQLPLIVKEAAQGLSGANVNILNGADGLGEIASGLVGQGMSILDSIKKGMGEQPPADADVGRAQRELESSPERRADESDVA